MGTSSRNVIWASSAYADLSWLRRPRCRPTMQSHVRFSCATFVSCTRSRAITSTLSRSCTAHETLRRGVESVSADAIIGSADIAVRREALAPIVQRVRRADRTWLARCSSSRPRRPSFSASEMRSRGVVAGDESDVSSELTLVGRPNSKSLATEGFMSDSSLAEGYIVSE